MTSPCLVCRYCTALVLLTVMTACEREETPAVPDVPPPPQQQPEPRATATPPATRPADAAAPDPALGPQEVVRVVMQALRHNDEPAPDAGIATAFAFASPANKRMTGPIERFTAMVKQSPAYAPMVDFRDVSYGPTRIIDGALAEQPVGVTTADGRQIAYMFVLSKQSDGAFKDCWMTDGVMPLVPRPAPGQDPDGDVPADPEADPAPDPSLPVYPT